MDNTSPRPPSQGNTGRSNPGQGASRGPAELPGFGGDGGSGRGGSGGRGFGGGGFGGFGGRGFGGRPGGFRGGMPNIFLVLAALAFLLGSFASCQPAGPTGPGQVAGQIKALSADRTITTLAGAQVILRGANETYTAVSTDVPDDAEGTEAYNYRIENVPPGRYTMAVTPPAGSALQPEAEITLEVESGATYPQSVMLLAEGIQKPRVLAPSELEPGQTGYINDRGERVTYNQGSGFDTTDALLLYLLFRNPPGFGYGAPPIVYPSRTGTPYRVEPPPSRTNTGGRVTTRQPSVPGQGTTRPSSAPASGPGPTYRGSGDSNDSPAAAPSNSRSGSATSPSNNSPSQGVTRPSSAPRTSAPARSGGSSGSRSSGGRR